MTSDQDSSSSSSSSKRTFPAAAFHKQFPKNNNSSNSLTVDCDRPACDDTVSNLTAAMNRLKQKSSTTTGTATLECPPKSAEIGKSSWTLLHSMAAYFPDHPTVEDERLMTGFYSALARFYPCTWCATDFTENLKQKPVQTKSREDLCMWLCEQHNIVNKKLGKSVFRCNMKNLDERWRKNEKCTDDH